MLVDFDLHNRGLTSKYGRFHQNTSTVLGELSRFRTSLLTSEKLVREAGQLSLSQIDEVTFLDLRRQFCYIPETRRQSAFNVEYLYQPKVRETDDRTGNVRAKQCFFMPSRRPADLFLGSTESRLDAAEIALFLMFLAHRAHGLNPPISQIIIDCHGAHDMFMVGSILAAQHLVIVSKPEESAFEGTIELVRFAQSAVEAENVFPSAQTLVFNEVRKSEQAVAKALYQLYYDNPQPGQSFEEIPTIPTSDAIKDAIKFYNSPCLANYTEIGQAIQKIISNHPSPRIRSS